jgi:hypothetical protein
MNNLPENNLQIESYERVCRLMDSAFTRAEVDGAEQAAREHLAQYPSDARRDLWHGWQTIVRALEEREEQARMLGLSPAQQVERENLLRASFQSIDVVNDTTARPKLAALRMALARWLERHPGDGLVTERLRFLDDEERLAAEFEKISVPSALKH